MKSKSKKDTRVRYVITLDPDVKAILKRYKEVTNSPSSVIINTLIRENIPALEFIIKTHQALSNGKIADKEATLKFLEQVNSSLSDNLNDIKDTYKSLSNYNLKGDKND